MKKILVLLVALFFLTGCDASKQSSPPVPDFNFTGNISVTYNNFDMNCKIENILGDKCVVTVVEPKIISGLTIASDDGACTFSIGDVSYKFDSDFARKAEFISVFTDSVKKILSSTEYEKLENGNWLYTGMTDWGKFLLVQDNLSGYPVSFRIPEAGLSITFSNMKPIDNGG